MPVFYRYIQGANGSGGPDYPSPDAPPQPWIGEARRVSVHLAVYPST